MRLFVILVFLVGATGCFRHDSVAIHVQAPRPTRKEIWETLQSDAKRYRLEPAFVYALIAAESNFDPAAHAENASGLLQLKPAAWKIVSEEPYEPTVFNWRENLRAGIEYLAYTRSYLHKKSVFSYPLLLAAFHYGIDYVEIRHFDLSAIAVPDNDVYRELWRGNLSPVPPP